VIDERQGFSSRAGGDNCLKQFAESGNEGMNKRTNEE
jgi:hypothetical protein